MTSESLSDTLQRLEMRYTNLRAELENLGSVDFCPKSKPQVKADIGRRDAMRTSMETKHDADNSVEASEKIVSWNVSAAPTPVHTRLLRRGLEQKAKLMSLKEQFEEKKCSTNIPKINETSKKIVEATRRRSGSLKDEASDTRGQDPSIEAFWKEYATEEGYLYYYNEQTKETRWERPLNGTILPYIPSGLRRRHSIDRGGITGK